MIWAFFVVGSLWFWLLLSIEIVLLTAFVDAEETWYSFWSVVVFLAILHLFGDLNIFTWLRDHPWDVVRIVALYGLLGVAWGVSKYVYNVNKVKSILKHLKAKFLTKWDEEREKNDFISQEKRRDADLDDDGALAKWDPKAHKQTKWKEYYEGEINHKDQRWIEFGSNGQAGTVIFWMAYWPVSFVWTIFSDMLKSAAKWFYYTCLVEIFAKIHRKTVGKELEIE